MTSNTDWIKFGIGVVNLNKGDIQRAEEIFNDIQAFGFAAAQLGFMRHKEENIEKAIFWYQKALDNLPGDEMGLFYRGLIHEKTGNYDDAVMSFLGFVKLNPNHFDAILNIACVFGRKGEYEKAQKVIEDAYQRNKSFRNCFAILGWIISERGDWSDALNIMNRDYEEGRIDPEWQVHLAQLFGRVGNWDMAIKLIKEAYTSEKSLKDGFARLGWIKAENQNWAGSINIMKRDVIDNRMTPYWRIHYAMLLVFMGDDREAERMIQNLYSFNNKIKDGYAHLGWANYLLFRDKMKLKALIAKDVGIGRLSVYGEKINAVAMNIDGDVNEAVSLVESLYSNYPYEKDGYAMIGWLVIENGDREAGMEFMERDYAANRLSTVWRTNYVYQLVKSGQFQKAKNIFDEVVEIEPYKMIFRIGFQIMPSIIMSLNDFQEMIGSDSDS